MMFACLIVFSGHFENSNCKLMMNECVPFLLKLCPEFPQFIVCVVDRLMT
jgi:hypothetical protein